MTHVKVTSRYRPNVINTTSEGVDAYATSDLVTPHPTKAGYYKVVGMFELSVCAECRLSHYVTKGGLTTRLYILQVRRRIPVLKVR